MEWFHLYSVSTVLHASILTINNTSETIYLLKTQLFYLCNLRIINADQSLSLLVHLTSNIKDLVYIVYIIITSNILIVIQLVWIDQLVCIFWKFKHNKIYFRSIQLIKALHLIKVYGYVFLFKIQICNTAIVCFFNMN